MKNVTGWDRLLRAVLALVFLELGFFWLAGSLQIGAYVVAAIMAITAASGFCGLYRLLGIGKACAIAPRPSGKAIALAVIVLVAVAVGGSMASAFFTRKLFLEDFNAMNDDYKQALFLTGKNEREKAVARYDHLLPAYAGFQAKYSAYQPYSLKGDQQLNADLARVAAMLADLKTLVHTGDLHEAHLGLEKVRPVFQDIFKRNGFSMLAVALVDFHDDMERLLDAANAKDSAALITLYPQVSEKLKTIEAEANDGEIQAIRKNMDDLLALAQANKNEQMPAQGEALKSSFVKVYLKRG